MKVILEFDTKLSEAEVRVVLLDALYEYQSHRGPNPEAYMEKRYPSSQGSYTGTDRVRKTESVRNRIELAKELHTAAWHWTEQKTEQKIEQKEEVNGNR